MGGWRTNSTQRYNCAHLVCTYLLMTHISSADVTAREIAQFHRLEANISQSISAMLNFLYSNRLRDTRFGFFMRGTTPFKKCDYPHHYTIELIDEAHGQR